MSAYLTSPLSLNLTASVTSALSQQSPTEDLGVTQQSKEHIEPYASHQVLTKNELEAHSTRGKPLQPRFVQAGTREPECMKPPRPSNTRSVEGLDTSYPKPPPESLAVYAAPMRARTRSSMLLPGLECQNSAPLAR